MSQTKLIISNNGANKEYILESFNKDAITFGRDDGCDIVIKNPKVSGYHGYIYRYNGSWYIQDHNSTNGMLINNMSGVTSELVNGLKITLDRTSSADSAMIYVQVITAVGGAAAGAAGGVVADGMDDRTVMSGVNYQSTSQAGAGQSRPQTGAGQQTGYAGGGYQRGTQTGTSQQTGYTGGSYQSRPQTGAGQQQTGYTGSGYQSRPQAGAGQQQTGYAGGGYQSRPQAGAGQQTGYTGGGYQSRPQTGMSYQSTPQTGAASQPGVRTGGGTPQNPRPSTNSDDSKKGKIGLILGIISIALVAGMMVFLFLFVFKKDDDKAGEEPTTVASTEKPSTTEDPDKELSAEEVFDIANVSTVEIVAQVSGTYGSLGTGFFIDENGTVATNYHVIDGTVKGYITTSDGQQYDIKSVKGYDKDLDIAILETDATNTIPLEQRTDEVKTGETIYALGSSKGYSGTFSEGIVSTAKREEKGHTYIQHTAPISNGNSGGPLLDTKARVIGLNNWVRTDGQNMNFAVPIEKIYSISADKSMSLEDVLEAEYGYSTSSGNDFSTGDWNGKTMCQEGSRTISLSLTDDFVVTPGGSQGSATFDRGSTTVAVETAIELGDYSNVTDEDVEKTDDVIIEEIGKSMEDIIGTDYDVNAESAEINGKNWRIYVFDGNGEYDNNSVVLMVAYYDDSLGMVMIASSRPESESEEIDNMIIDIMSSVEYK